ncbi:MAG: amidase [Janthinobacterium lividum]
MEPDIFRLGVRVLGKRMRARTLRAREVLDHYLERIERLNPTLNAFVTIDADGARRSADAADARFAQQASLGPLDGIPIAIKDNILVAGQRAVWGSCLYEHHIPEHDELPVALLRSAGAVLLGKTNVPEFTLRGYTGNPVFGVTGNPWNPALTPGGSSGGSVAAIASGLVPLSLATDGGGSIRRPAGYAGLVGLKPTLSRIPRAGGLPQILYDCEVVGPLARTSDDLRLMMSVIARPHRLDPRSRGFMPIMTSAQPPKSLRIRFVERFGDAPVDAEIIASCRHAAAVLRKLGHRVESGPLPLSIDQINAQWLKFGNVGLSMLSRLEKDFDALASAAFVEQARSGDAISGAEYLQLLEMLFAFRSEAGRVFEDLDIIMTPTAAAQPWPKATAFPAHIDGRDAGPRGHAVFTNWVNACGHPAIALPAPPSLDGMPIGLQLVGDFGADELLLDLAAQYEVASPWAQRWPEIAVS